MKARAISFLLLAALALAACQKNTASKIPHIALIAFYPDSMHANIDTAYIQFSLSDGDGDLGNDSVSGIYFKDSRFPDLGFIKADFPDIDPGIEDPKKGLEGTCLFFPVPTPTPRNDTFHIKHGDTLSYELYIKDRANNESNHIVTKPLIVRP